MKTLQEFLETAYRPGKMHLFHLPPVQNFPAWQGDAKEVCVVIPIFNSSRTTDALVDYVAQSACWAARCWKVNTDAQSLGIPVFIYYEIECAEVVLPIVEASGIPTSHLLEFSDATHRLEGHAKKLNILLDTRFAAYKKVIISDSDTFPLAATNGEKHPILQRVVNREMPPDRCEIIIAENIDTGESLENSPGYYWEHHAKTWREDIPKFIHPSERAEVVIDIFAEEGRHFSYPWAAYYVFEPKKMWGMASTIIEGCRYLRDDEFVMSLLETAIPEVTLLNGKEVYGAPFIPSLDGTEFINYIHKGEREAILLHATTSVDFYFQGFIGVHHKFS